MGEATRWVSITGGSAAVLAAVAECVRETGALDPDEVTVSASNPTAKPAGKSTPFTRLVSRPDRGTARTPQGRCEHMDGLFDWIFNMGRGEARQDRRLDELEAAQEELTEHVKRLERHMATAEEYVTRIDEATTAVANDIKAVKDELAALTAGGATASQAAVDAALAKLDPSIATLESLGTDNSPVPAPAPTDPNAPPPAGGSGGITVGGDTGVGDVNNPPQPDPATQSPAAGDPNAPAPA